jgi:hypothetical protein
VSVVQARDGSGLAHEAAAHARVTRELRPQALERDPLSRAVVERFKDTPDPPFTEKLAQGVATRNQLSTLHDVQSTTRQAARA